jgi:Major Facilitator Superfamily
MLVGANAVMLLVASLAYGVPFVLTLYAQQVLGYSAVEFGVGSVVLAVGAAVGAIVGQAAVLKVGFRAAAATGLALMGAGSLFLTQVSVGGSYFGDIFVGLLVVGPGVGLGFVTATVAALAGVAEHESGLASGLSNTALQIGGALGVALATTVAVSRTDDYVAVHGGVRTRSSRSTKASSQRSSPSSSWPGSAWRLRSSSSADHGQHCKSGPNRG